VKAEGTKRMQRTVETYVRNLQKHYKCKCSHVDALMCHECDESDGVCYCKCHIRRLPEFHQEQPQ
jgi:hypothetical protein